MQDKLRTVRRRRHFILAGLAFGLQGAWMALPASAATAATGAGPLLVLGDSLSAEYGLARGTGWVALLQQRLQENGKAVALVNASVSGETTSGGRSRLPALLKQHRPSVVVIELGGNDALRGLPLTGTQANLDAMVGAAREAGARVLLLGMQVPPNYGTAYAQQFSDMFGKVARQHKAALVPFLLAGIGDVPDAAQWFQSDRIHPNAKAQPHMLDNVWPQLRELLP